MDNYIINKTLGKIKQAVWGEFPKLSYSRSGEDLMLDDLFQYKSTGFFIDVGAFHPVKYSNTYKFYLKGWRGINIDPNKEVIELFDKVRPGDRNLNIAVSNVAGKFDYFMNELDPSMNTISKIFADETSSKFGFDIVEKRSVNARRLEDILADMSCDLSKIDFLNIDVEGHDFEVLQSNNWELIRPKVVLIEINSALSGVYSSAIYHYMAAKNYSLISYSYLNDSYGNGFFVKND